MAVVLVKSLLGSFSNGGGNENVKTAIGLLSKTTSLLVHHGFLYVSLQLLHDYDVKTSDDEIFFLFLNLSAVPKKSTPGIFACIRHFQRIRELE